MRWLGKGAVDPIDPPALAESGITANGTLVASSAGHPSLPENAITLGHRLPMDILLFASHRDHTPNALVAEHDR
jgi:hypothetical protein